VTMTPKPPSERDVEMATEACDLYIHNHISDYAHIDQVARLLAQAREEGRSEIIQKFHINPDNGREMICGKCGEHARQVCTHLANAIQFADQQREEGRVMGIEQAKKTAERQRLGDMGEHSRSFNAGIETVIRALAQKGGKP